MRVSRRFSQAISEGDGISLLAEADGADAARAAEDAGAEAIVVRNDAAAVVEATGLPVLWCAGSPRDAANAGAHAYLLVFDDPDEGERVHAEYAQVAENGLECVVEVGDEDGLQTALDRLDPEIVLLTARRRSGDGLEHVLSLLPDVPAGKLAIAELDVRDREATAELERAGVDGVVVPARRVADLLTAVPPAL